MRIGESKRTREEFIKRGKRKEALDVKHSPFLENLQQQEITEIDFDAALAEIDDLGRELCEHPILVNLKNYKAAVRAILKLIVNEGLAIEERRFVDQYGRRRVFLLVAQVDKQLEKLTHLILNKQASTIDLASKLDEIRGLLLDINL